MDRSQYNGLRTMRRVRGLTQGQLAELSGSSQAVISQIESGQRNFSFGLAVRLARALNVSVDDLGRAVAEFDTEPDELQPA
jgi:transcriptional regulator with XRE-family HTH domain